MVTVTLSGAQTIFPVAPVPFTSASVGVFQVDFESVLLGEAVGERDQALLRFVDAELVTALDAELGHARVTNTRRRTPSTARPRLQRGPASAKVSR